MEGNSSNRNTSPDMDYDHSTARLFASTSNLNTNDDRIADKEEKKLQKRNLAIIQNILQMFDLEETKKMYETKDVVEYTMDPNDFGYDCSLSTTRVRQRLCDLMGTDVIRLNDRRYFQKLSNRLQEEYETAMDKQETVRAATEDDRLRRLMLEGIIKAPTDYRAVIHNEHKKKPRKRTKRTSKKQKSGPDQDALIGEVTYSNTARSEADREKPVHEEVETQVQKLTGNRPRSSHANDSTHVRTKQEVISMKTKQEGHSTQPLHDISSRPPHHTVTMGSTDSTSRVRARSASARYSHLEHEERIVERRMESLSDTHSLPDMDQKKPTKYSQQESPLVQDLRREETVSGLYAIAEELISPVPTQQDARKVQKRY